MQKKVPVFMFGAVLWVSSCGADGRANFLRSAGQFGPTSDLPSANEKDKLPLRVTSCLALGRERLGDLSAEAEIDSFDLGSLSCGDCGIRISLVVPSMWRRPVGEALAYSVYDLRVGIVFGRLSLREPSDTVLLKLRDDCPKWAAIPSNSEQSACKWERKEGEVWVSGIVDILPNVKIELAGLKLSSKTAAGEIWEKPEKLATFSEKVTVDAAATMGADLRIPAHFVSFALSLSGEAGFIPIAVQAVERSSGELLGCLPFRSG